MVALWILIGLIAIPLLISLILFLSTFYHVPGTETDKMPLPPEAKALLLKKTEEMQAVPCERVRLYAADGTALSARLYDAPEGAPIVIACHGFKGVCDYSFSMLFPWYRELGYRILMIDQRAHGQSEGRTITLGVKEKTDIAGWVQYMEQRFGMDVPITLWGVSMGGHSVLTAMELCPELKCVVSDCPFTTTTAIVRYIIERKCKPLAKPILWLTQVGTKLWGGFSLKEGDALRAVRQTKTPVLIIHGELDDFVPYAMGKELYEACGSQKEFLSVPDAKHARSAAVHPELYKEHLQAFLKKHIS